jgi:hypothetical protein
MYAWNEIPLIPCAGKGSRSAERICSLFNYGRRSWPTILTGKFSIQHCATFTVKSGKHSSIDLTTWKEWAVHAFWLNWLKLFARNFYLLKLWCLRPTLHAFLSLIISTLDLSCAFLKMLVTEIYLSKKREVKKEDWTSCWNRNRI